MTEGDKIWSRPPFESRLYVSLICTEKFKDDSCGFTGVYVPGFLLAVCIYFLLTSRKQDQGVVVRTRTAAFIR